MDVSDQSQQIEKRKSLCVLVDIPPSQTPIDRSFSSSLDNDIKMLGGHSTSDDTVTSSKVSILHSEKELE